MALKPNASMVFTRYEIERDGVTLWFVCPDPGAGEPSDYEIFFPDAELGIATTPIVVTNIQTFGDACIQKLKRHYRAEQIAAKLNPLLGRTLTLP
jgi:hypothetical protein